MVELHIITLASIGVISLVCQWIAWRLRLPAILFLLIAGILMGPGFGFLEPDALFGDLLFPIVSLAVAVILFEGSLTLKFSEMREHGKMVRNLLSNAFKFTEPGGRVWIYATPEPGGARLQIGEEAFGVRVTAIGETEVILTNRWGQPESLALPQG